MVCNIPIMKWFRLPGSFSAGFAGGIVGAAVLLSGGTYVAVSHLTSTKTGAQVAAVASPTASAVVVAPLPTDTPTAMPVPTDTPAPVVQTPAPTAPPAPIVAPTAKPVVATPEPDPCAFTATFTGQGTANGSGPTFTTPCTRYHYRVTFQCSTPPPYPSGVSIAWRVDYQDGSFAGDGGASQQMSGNVPEQGGLNTSARSGPVTRTFKVVNGNGNCAWQVSLFY